MDRRGRRWSPRACTRLIGDCACLCGGPGGWARAMGGERCSGDNKSSGPTCSCCAPLLQLTHASVDATPHPRIHTTWHPHPQVLTLLLCAVCAPRR